MLSLEVILSIVIHHVFVPPWVLVLILLSGTLHTSIPKPLYKKQEKNHFISVPRGYSFQQSNIGLKDLKC